MVRKAENEGKSIGCVFVYEHKLAVEEATTFHRILCKLFSFLFLLRCLYHVSHLMTLWFGYMSVVRFNEDAT